MTKEEMLSLEIEVYLMDIGSTIENMVVNQNKPVSIEDAILELKDIYDKDCIVADQKTIDIAREKIQRRLRCSEGTDFVLEDDKVYLRKFEPFTCEFKCSGKVFIQNDLRDLFEEKHFGVNASSGIIKTMEHYAKQGMLHGFVGNSCPTLYINESSKIVIGKPDTWERGDEIPEGWKKLSWVCTDLWWYSIVDRETIIERDPNFKEENYDFVDIPAGTYRLTHKYGISERGYHENLPYATLELLK